MSPMRARYVTACQQLLALGVVVMALVPATRVISLDVVGVGPGQGIARPTISVSPDPAAGGSAEAGMSGYARVQQRCAPRSLRVAERRSTGTIGHQCLVGGQHPARTTAGVG
ncbi:MAG: hypothetical protein QOD98_390 [Nocardioidaceae bacterium]|nr:hypothetical protein [Nocardioidaceae bacterium]